VWNVDQGPGLGWPGTNNGPKLANGLPGPLHEFLKIGDVVPTDAALAGANHEYCVYVEDLNIDGQAK